MCNRRCCCQGIYYTNSDSVSEQLRPQPTILHPKIVNGLAFSSVGFAIDYHNQRIVIAKLTVGAGATEFQITDSLALKSSKRIGVSQATLHDNFDESRLLACDWQHKRFFYFGELNTGITMQLRKCGYDGSGDAAVATESLPGGADLIFPRTLQYDPASDRVYYVRGKNSGGFKTELRRVNSDGTGQATQTDYSSLDLGLFSGHFVAPPINAAILTYRDTSAADAHSNFHWKLLLSDLATGATTLVLSGYRRMFSPQYCYRDGKIYFHTDYLTGVGNARNQATYNRVNLDGSNEEVVFSFAGDNDLHWGSLGGSAADFPFSRLDCNHEIGGASYIGVG